VNPGPGSIARPASHFAAAAATSPRRRVPAILQNAVAIHVFAHRAPDCADAPRVATRALRRHRDRIKAPAADWKPGGTRTA